MFKINEENYEYYKKIAEVIWDFQFKDYPVEINGENLPINVLNKWEQKSKSLARRGLKAGLIDSLMMLKDANEEYILRLNEQLIKSDLPGVNKLRRRKIKNLDEYYIIKEIIDDTDSGISEEKREQLNRLFGEFEINFPKKEKDR
jgi:hypothetical protein